VTDALDEGDTLGVTDGAAEGEVLGEVLGLTDGLSKGDTLGEMIGLTDGVAEGEEELGVAAESSIAST
jgi:hypothetical protein